METSFGGQGGAEMAAAMYIGMAQFDAVAVDVQHHAGMAAAMYIWMALFVGFMVLVSVVLTIVIWWKIFSKAGWSGALGLLMLVPIVNFIMALYVAFATWPIQRELEALKRGRQ